MDPWESCIADGLGQRHKDRMARLARVAGIQLAAPQLKKRERRLRVARLVAQIVGDAAIGVDCVEMGAQFLGKKPRGHVEVLVVGLRQPLAVLAGFFESGRNIWNAIILRQGRPATGYRITCQASLFVSFAAASFSVSDCTFDVLVIGSPQGTIAVLISLLRFINFSKTRLSSYRCAWPVMKACA